jgi:hypothetical protein
VSAEEAALDTRGEGVKLAQERRRAYREQVARQTAGQLRVGSGNDLF